MLGACGVAMSLKLRQIEDNSMSPPSIMEDMHTQKTTLPAHLRLTEDHHHHGPPITEGLYQLHLDIILLWIHQYVQIRLAPQVDTALNHVCQILIRIQMVIQASPSVTVDTSIVTLEFQIDRRLILRETNLKVLMVLAIVPPLFRLKVDQFQVTITMQIIGLFWPCPLLQLRNGHIIEQQTSLPLRISVKL